MANGLLGGLGKLLHMGALHLQHVNAARSAASVGGDAGHQQLYDYFADLTDTQYAGFKISVAMAANNEADPAMRDALAWIAGNADALRSQPPAHNAAYAASGTPATLDYGQAVAMLTHWYELACAQRSDEVETALAQHVANTSDASFQSFLAQLQQMHRELDSAIAQARNNEANAWGGFTEDRIAYLQAKLRTGSSDPRVEAEIAKYQDQQAFLQKVYDYAVRCRNAASAVEPAPVAENARAQVDDNAGTTRDDGDLDADAIFKQFETLRQQALDSGELRGERGHATKAWLGEVERIVRANQNGDMSPTETIAAMQRVYRKRQDMVRDTGADLQLHLPADCRAHSISRFVQSIKQHVATTAIGGARGQTHNVYTEVFAGVARCVPRIKNLADDNDAVAFERTDLRPLAMQAHELALLPHLVVARPFWECHRVDPSPNVVFFAGAEDLRKRLDTALSRQRLDRATSRSGRYYGQARWDLLRASHLCVFDWRASERDLAAQDPEAAAAQAAIAYELGLALSLGRPVVIVARERQRLPFDIDIEPVRLSDDTATAVDQLCDAIDNAFYEPQRIADDGCLAETQEMLQTVARQLNKTHVFEGMGWLDPKLVTDPVAFHAAAQQIVRDAPALELITPAWASPAITDMPILFHVTPFSLDWSNAGRDAVRRACEQADITHSDGASARDARILQRIWDGLYRARWVIADVTDLNPNVFIELGMAHALGRPTLIVERARDDQPPPAIRNLEKIEFARYRDFKDLERQIVEWVGGS